MEWARKKLSVDPFERIFIDTFINISLSAIINGINFSIDNIFCETFSSLLSAIVFGILISTVLFSSFGIQKLKQKLMNEKIKYYFSVFYEDLRIEKRKALAYYGIFFLRRIIFIATIFLLSDYPYFQLQYLQLSCIIQIYYIIKIKPHEVLSNNHLEILNEITLYSLTMIYLIFIE